MSPLTVLRGPAAFFRSDPFDGSVGEALGYDADALIALQDGRITHFGPAAAVGPELPRDATVEHVPDSLIVPGFVDCHVHFAQLGIVGACGHQLLEWLTRHTFPAEQAFEDRGHASNVARRFVAELLANGTTTAVVYGTVHGHSVDALFEAAGGTGLRIVAGKALMDRNAPEQLRDTAQSGYDDSKRLIERWHGRGRFGYAVTPRFVATSTPEQLDTARALRQEFPGVWLQSHVAENTAEVAWVRTLFPEAADYVDVLDRFGLLGPRAIHGHGIHLSDRERRRLADTGSAIAHCPTSNLFLGSGLFDLAAAKAVEPRVEVGLATDVGAGTSLSMLKTMGAAYQVAQLRDHAVSPSQLLWLATAGAARALGAERETGNLGTGLDADVVVLDPKATPLLAWRCAQADGAEQLLGVLLTMGDDRCVRTVFAGGHRHDRPGSA
ncbi:MAG: guanine deaminase [Betaproteobacteria bacterium]|nr:guanine deaminase [Betaproteobacteria bacterium]